MTGPARQPKLPLSLIDPKAGIGGVLHVPAPPTPAPPTPPDEPAPEPLPDDRRYRSPDLAA